jgi:hypothetical protein
VRPGGKADVVRCIFFCFCGIVTRQRDKRGFAQVEVRVERRLRRRWRRGVAWREEKVQTD